MREGSFASGAGFGQSGHDGFVLDSLAPARRRTVLSVVALVALAVVGAVGYGVIDRLSGPGGADQTELGPVIVVPGYGGQASSVEPVVTALQAAGRDVTVLRPVGGGTGDLVAQAERLDDAARAAMEQADAASVDVVGYSAGGVVARLWVRGQGGADVARRVLSIGSPQHGTDIAALAVEVAGSCPTACEQLAPESDLLRGLNAGDETPDGPAWITVSSTSDRVVTPTESAELADALNIVVQDFCPASTTTHAQLPADPVLLAALQTTLGPAEPRIPIETACGS